MNRILPISFGEVLKTVRKKKRINQQVIADRLGVHFNTISKWERGICLPGTKGIVLELAQQLHLDEQETRQLLTASLVAISPYWIVPYQRNPFFAGHTTLLHQLHHQLHSEQSTAWNRSYAINGLAGIGKTQLALEYAYRYAHEYYAIFWITAETQETIFSSFFLIAEQLPLPEHHKKEQKCLVKAVLNWFSTHKEWLLIFDQVEDIATIKPFFPSARQGAILLTTRLHTLDGLAHTLELPLFTLEEGCHFLLSRSKLIDAASPMHTLSKELFPFATILVEAMERLPLALDQAGAYIEKTGCRLADYIQMFQHNQLYLLDIRASTSDYPHSVVKTFSLAFEMLKHTNAAAADMLRVCAFLASDPIPEEFFIAGATHLGPTLAPVLTNAYLFNQMIGDALHYSLLTRQPQNHAFSLHRLVQTVVRMTMTQQESVQWIERIVLAMNMVFYNKEQIYYVKHDRLVYHAIACSAYMMEAININHTLSSLLSKIALYLYDRAQHIYPFSS